MSISLVVFARRPDDRVAATLALFRGVADELIVAVDVGVEPSKPVLAIADRVMRFAWPDPPQLALPWLCGECRGEWLLWLEDDEVPSQSLLDALPDLARARDAAWYRLGYRELAGATKEYRQRMVATDPRLLAARETPGRYLREGLYALGGLVDLEDVALPDGDLGLIARVLSGHAPSGDAQSVVSDVPQDEIEGRWAGPDATREVAVTLVEAPSRLHAGDEWVCDAEIETADRRPWPWPGVDLVFRWRLGGEPSGEERVPLPSAAPSQLVPLVLRAGRGRGVLARDRGRARGEPCRAGAPGRGGGAGR